MATIGPDIEYFQCGYIVKISHYETDNKSKLIKTELSIDRTKLLIDIDVINIIYDQISLLVGLSNHDVILSYGGCGTYRYLDDTAINTLKESMLTILNLYNNINNTFISDKINDKDQANINASFLNIINELRYVNATIQNIMNFINMVDSSKYHDPAVYRIFIENIMEIPQIIFNRYRQYYKVKSISPMEKFINNLYTRNVHYMFNYSIRRYKKLLRNKGV